MRLAGPGEYKKVLEKNAAYFLEGRLPESNDLNGRKSETLELVPNINYKAPSFLPTWMVAYTYPKNVNADGIKIQGDNDEHNRMLPLPVFPTPFYETIIGLLLFLLLWLIRKRIKIPGILFGIYLVLNGLERYTIEKIRVNDTYNIFGYHPSQAQVIAVLLILTGILLCIFQYRRSKQA